MMTLNSLTKAATVVRIVGDIATVISIAAGFTGMGLGIKRMKMEKAEGMNQTIAFEPESSTTDINAEKVAE